jgi:hypothetical protein
MLEIAAFAAAQSLPATVVAREGQAAPGVDGATLAQLGNRPRLGAGGHVAFGASLSGGGVTSENDAALWVGMPNNLQVAIRKEAGLVSSIFSGNVGVDAGGGVSGFHTSGLFSYLPGGNGGNTLVAQPRVTSAPGFGGGATYTGFYGSPSAHASSSTGAVAFEASVSGGDAVSGSNSGIFAGTPGAVQLVARTGAAAPGATGTAPMYLEFTDQRINAGGQVAFATSLTGAGTNQRAIYVWSPGGAPAALAAQIGTPLPGISATTTLINLDQTIGFNDAGQVAFQGQISGTEAGFGIWAGAPGEVKLIARTGTPTSIGGTVFLGPDAGPRINLAGQVAFGSSIGGAGVSAANDRVLLVAGGGGASPVARTGTMAPGTSGGVTFSQLGLVEAINGRGQVAFTGTLAGTGVTTANDKGLWAGIPGFVSLVAREGDQIDVDPGEGVLMKTISSFNFAGDFPNVPNTTSYSSAALNDAGQIAWWAEFTDSTTAVFLTDVPLPSLTADFDGDLDVDLDDLAKWKAGFGTGGNALHVQGDADFDFDVDGNDFLLWQRQLGSAPGLINVPEPDSSILALALAACTLLFAKHPPSFVQTRDDD